MQNTKLVYIYLTIISASVICFEIISTRISSVIFVSNYAFIILSLAILGLAFGGIYSYYKINIESVNCYKLIYNLLILSGSSLIFFIICITELKITSPFLYFFLFFIPLFFFGIIYAQIFKNFASYSFKLYASDLLGAALGSAASIFIIGSVGAPNSILLLALLIFGVAGIYLIGHSSIKKIALFYSIVTGGLLFLIFNGNINILKEVPIGKFDEKDFYYVYPNAEEISEIVESRWSIFGRSDLVQYRDQDVVKHLFIDGAAGSPMYHFNGDVKTPDRLLYNLLISQSNAVPFFYLSKYQMNNMLIIGPGGGREVLLGLLTGVEQITGVEINPDFVNIVKKNRSFNGGIYTDFPNVNIKIAEGRHFIIKSDSKYDIIVMALPSTKQMQNIDGLAENENYLLTVEALKDYLNTLTNEGALIFTVHNKWELLRLIITTISAFEKLGIDPNNALNHFAIIETEYTPTIVIRKNPFTENEVANWINFSGKLLRNIPAFSYMPYGYSTNKNSIVNSFLYGLKENRYSLDQYIGQHPYNIKPCTDDSPYFYKVNKGVPNDFAYLALGMVFFNSLIIGIPLSKIRRKFAKDKVKEIKIKSIKSLLLIFACMGLGFMMLEISLFQKLILFLGSPTVSLSILLSSLLIGMGAGSFFGRKIYVNNNSKRLLIISCLIVTAGVLFFFLYPLILGGFLKYSLFLRAIISFEIILPLGFLLGIPFPTSLQLLKAEDNENLIPWMYGVNGAMSVLGSVLAVILSMLSGYTVTFFTGLFFYLLIFILTLGYQKILRAAGKN